MKKRILYRLLVLGVLCCMLPLLLLWGSAAGGNCGTGVTWSLDEASGLLKISGNGAMNDYIIGETPWAPMAEQITAVEITDGVTAVGNWAFSELVNLSSVSIAQSVTEIGDSAFYGCTGLTFVSLPAGMEILNEGLFYGCTSLREVQIPAGVHTIENVAFSGCESLKSVWIPDNVTVLGDYAFSGCAALEQVTLPESLGMISEGAFDSCAALREIRIPATATAIGDYAFFGCKSLETVILGENVTSIGWSAFDACVSLKEITIPAKVETLGWGAFQGCTGLTEIKLPACVGEIGYRAFADCTALTRMEIANPQCDVYAAEETLGDPNITWIYCPEDATYVTYLEDYGYVMEGVEIPEEDAPADPVLDETVKIAHSLNLESDISLNYVVSASKLEYAENYYLECVIPTYSGNTLVGTETVKIDPVQKGSYYYFTLTGLAAIHMNNEMEARLYYTKDGVNYVSLVDNYSIAQYAYSAMAKSDVGAELKTLCADLLRYGASAQTFKGYRTDALADRNMTAEQKAYLTDLNKVTLNKCNETLNDLEGATVQWVGKTLVLDNKVELKFVFNLDEFGGDRSDLRMEVSYVNIAGETETVMVENLEVYNAAKNQYSMTFDGLLAAELRIPVEVKIYSGNEQVSCTLRFSAESYGIGKTGALGDLCKAVIAYSDSAKAYYIKVHG